MPSTFSTTVDIYLLLFRKATFVWISKRSCWNFGLNLPKVCDARYLEYYGETCYILLERARKSSRFVNHDDLQRHWNSLRNIFVSLWFPLGTLTKALFQHRKFKLELSTKNLDWFSLPGKQVAVNFTVKTSHSCPRKVVPSCAFQVDTTHESQ